MGGWRDIGAYLKSAGFRFAALFAVLFIAAILGFALMLWWGTAGTLSRQIDDAIRADAIGLQEAWRGGGAAAVKEAIGERLAVDIDDHAIYLLTDDAGSRLAGNLDRWPPAAEIAGSWSAATVRRDGVAVPARMFHVPLAGGHRVLVGRDAADREKLRSLLSEALLWSFAVAVAFALAGAAALRRALADRLRAAAATAGAIAAGDLSRRVPLSTQRDEFDQLGESMNAMLDRIDQLMAGIKGVSDSIAHDLRTPIARARMRLENALLSAPDEESLRAAMETTVADLDGISRVFQALLRIAEAEAGARRAAFAPFDLATVLTDAAEVYGALAEERGQHLETAWPERLTMVGDRDMVLQAIANLLDNAVKFTPEGGTIRLSASAPARGKREISVRDEGPGLAAEDRARAGERFFRADPSRALPGSGLGLSLVKAVAALHGGELRLGDGQPRAARPGLEARLTLSSRA
ncbi:MAG: HAMP domain-containing histidine kinase [Roseomonas sp.]|nr:HAMP domain-containing histidine kinase [Roseomonas sp.]